MATVFCLCGRNGEYLSPRASLINYTTALQGAQLEGVEVGVGGGVVIPAVFVGNLIFQ